LLDALDHYEGKKIHFSFVGHIDDVDDFENRLSAINERKSVVAIYHGSKDSPEDLLRAHDCLVLPSMSEGMPNVVLEAAACGLYLILSNIAVHQELTELVQGECFKLGDSGALLQKIYEFNDKEYL